MQIRLNCRSGALAGQAFEFDAAAVTIGTDTGNSLQIDPRQEPRVSQRHCEFFEQQGQLFVRDLNSKNGTLVNGFRIRQPVPVQFGAAVRLGKDGPEFSLAAPRSDQPLTMMGELFPDKALKVERTKLGAASEGDEARKRLKTELTLTCRRGALEGQTWTYADARISLGRDPSNTLQLHPDKDLRASGRHCEIFLLAGRFIVRDLGSSHGTWLNGNRIAEPTLLTSGSVLALGQQGPEFDVRVSNSMTLPEALSGDLPSTLPPTLPPTLQPDGGAPARKAKTIPTGDEYIRVPPEELLKHKLDITTKPAAGAHKAPAGSEGEPTLLGPIPNLAPGPKRTEAELAETLLREGALPPSSPTPVPEAGSASGPDLFGRYVSEGLGPNAPAAPATDSAAEAKREAEVRAKQEAEAKAKREAEERANQEAEAKAKREAEERAKQEAAAKAKREAEERTKQEAEAKAKREAEERTKQEAEAKAKREAEERAKQEAEVKAKREAEERAKQEAEVRAKREAEERAKQEAEAKAKREAEERAKQEAEAKAMREAEERAKQEAEAKAKREAEEHAKQEAAAKAKREAEERAKQEAEAKAKREVDERAKQEAEAKAKQHAEERARQEELVRKQQAVAARAKQETTAEAVDRVEVIPVDEVAPSPDPEAQKRAEIRDGLAAELLPLPPTIAVPAPHAQEPAATMLAVDSAKPVAGKKPNADADGEMAATMLAVNSAKPAPGSGAATKFNGVDEPATTQVGPMNPRAEANLVPPTEMGLLPTVQAPVDCAKPDAAGDPALRKLPAGSIPTTVVGSADRVAPKPLPRYDTPATPAPDSAPRTPDTIFRSDLRRDDEAKPAKKKADLGHPPAESNALEPVTNVRPVEPMGTEDFPAVQGYTFHSKIGIGPLGSVYRVRHNVLKRPMALKLVLADTDFKGFTESDRLRFKADIESAAYLEHPHIVQVFAVGQYNGNPQVAMEYLPGGDLGMRLAAQPQDPKWSAELIVKLASALHAGHKQSIFHRAMKPANVLFNDDGEPRITDYGISRLMEIKAEVTKKGMPLGELCYMSPENIRGDESRLRPTCDVYSLGAILYECLTGYPPFPRLYTGVLTGDIMKLVVEQDPAPPTQVKADIPRPLEYIVMQCLRKDPAARYATTDDLAQDLQRFLKGERVLAQGKSFFKRLLGR